MVILHSAMWHDHDIDFARRLQCGMWHWNYNNKFTKWQYPSMWYVALGWHAIEFARLQHPAMWHVALASWHWIRQVATLANSMSWSCIVVGGSGMTCHWIRPNVCHIGILHLVSISTISPQSTCHSAPVCEILSKFSKWRISAILDFRGPIMGSLKSPCTTSYRSSMETTALNCSVFEKIAFLHFGDRQTDRQTDGHHRCSKPLSLSRAAA